MKAYLVLFSFLVGIMFMPIYSIKVEVSLSEDVCRYFKNGEIIRSPHSCSETIKCQDGKSIPHSLKCTGDKIISLSTMKCDSKPKAADGYCTPTCAKSSPKWIEDKKNCREWHECKNSTLGQTGFCPEGQMFVQKDQKCIYDNGNCNRTYDICNVAKISVAFWDEDNCHKYYVCDKKGTSTDIDCKLGYYYDPRLGECVAKAQVNCYKHPTPAEACGNAKLAIRNRFVKDRATCRGYFYCKSKDVIKKKDGSWNYDPDKYPNWSQCPINKFFDEELQSCLDQNDVKCDEDRCDGHMSGKVLSETPGCQHYLECKDGYTLREVPCEDSKYFDPVTETCVYRKITYPICS